MGRRLLWRLLLCFLAAVGAEPRRASVVASSALHPTAPLQKANTLRIDATKHVRRLLRSDAARHLIAGATAGVVSNTIVAPLDIVRLNLMVSKQQTNALKVATKIVADGGFFALWQGNLADVIRTIPASAVRFYSFAVYKATLPAYLALACITAPAVTSVLAGGFAGMTAMALLFPLETVRTQMATNGALNGISMLAFTRGLVAQNGLHGLYRGLPASLISVMPYFGVRFGVYDILRRYHIAVTGSEIVPSKFSAAYGFAAGFSASGLTFPMEVVRRRAMVGAAGSNLFKAVPAIIRAEGIAGLYKGYAINVVKVAPASAITFFTYETVRKQLDSFANG